MLKLLMNLKKTWVSVVAIVILLCVQAWADLTLPDYTSKIVNIGIQASGIENASPDVIRKSQMDELLILTNEDNTILKNYTLLSKENLEVSEYEKQKEKYPILETEDIYVINNITKEEREMLNKVISKPFMLISILEDEQMENTLKESILTNISDDQKAIFSNMTILQILGTMTEDTRSTIVEQINKNIDDNLGTMLEQAVVSLVKEEYKNIGINLDSLQNSYIVKIGIQMLGVALISMVSAISIIFLSSRVAARLGKTLRDKVFRKVLSFSREEFSNFSTASLITRSTNDIQQIQMLITMLFRVVVYAPIMGIGGFLRVLANGNTSMAWIIGLAILCVAGIVLTLFLVAMPRFKKLQDLIDKLNLVSREILTGLPVIRAFNTEKREEDRFEKANRDLMKNYVFVNRAMSLMMPSLMFVMNSVMLLIIWVGGHSVDQGIIQVGDMMAFIQYTMHIIMSFLVISMISIMLPRAQVSANRINEVLETKPRIKDPENAKEFDENKKGLVEFKNVSFKYPDADSETISDINFVAEPGKTTAIIGTTGSGKSTIVNLIPRFYDVTGGELLVDGVNVKNVSQKELRKKIGFVPQRGMLFSGTIASNIKYGNTSISDEEMMKSAKIAQAEEFILEKEDKYNAPISQGGTNVSGGQKQRLSIARAIAIDPEIFVFDDSFSALDLKTDLALRTALITETKNKTVIIVAQRISTILNADQIIVLEDGKMMGKGTHKELMENCESYREIALSQLSKEELE